MSSSFSHSQINWAKPWFIKVMTIATDMADKVATMVKEKPLVIFSKSTCCMSHTIKTLFSDFGANATIYELDEIPQGKEAEQNLARRGYNPTVPIVFIGGEFVGGANEVMSLHINRSLVPMLKSAGALWLWKDDHL